MSMQLLLSREQIYKDYRATAFSYISARVHSYEDAEDLCEEVFVKLFRLLERYDENRASVSTLIYKFSHDIVIDWYRTHRVHEELSEEQVVLPSAEDTVMDNERFAELRDALSELPQPQRDILILRFYRGWKLVRIAEELGITYNTAVSRQNKALEILRKKLGDRHI